MTPQPVTEKDITALLSLFQQEDWDTRTETSFVRDEFQGWKVIWDTYDAWGPSVDGTSWAGGHNTAEGEYKPTLAEAIQSAQEHC
jgi:hypothetical protein